MCTAFTDDRWCRVNNGSVIARRFRRCWLLLLLLLANWERCRVVVFATRFAGLWPSGQRGNGRRPESLDELARTPTAPGDGNRHQEGRHQEPHQHRPRHRSPQDHLEGRILRTVIIIGRSQGRTSLHAPFDALGVDRLRRLAVTGTRSWAANRSPSGRTGSTEMCSGCPALDTATSSNRPL